MLAFAVLKLADREREAQALIVDGALRALRVAPSWSAHGVGAFFPHLWPGPLRAFFFCRPKVEGRFNSSYVPRRPFFVIFELTSEELVIVRNPKHCSFQLRVFCLIGNVTHLCRALIPVP